MPRHAGIDLYCIASENVYHTNVRKVCLNYMFCTMCSVVRKYLKYRKMIRIHILEPCTVANSDSSLIVDIVESLGSQTSQSTNPKELPLSGMSSFFCISNSQIKFLS